MNIVSHLEVNILYLLLFVITFYINFTSVLNNVTPDSNWTSKCPSQCHCDIDGFGKKRILCSKETLSYIPIQQMDPNIQVLAIKGSQNKLHSLSIGRIFGSFFDLERVVITHSQIPAIGEATFWPGGKIRVIDLSHNRIQSIQETDFIGLDQLDELNLADNRISTPPSAPFKHLTNLTSLSIARNRLKTLVPRMFFQLKKLETLNLSGNPLVAIHPDDIKDAVKLKRLYLADCQLKRIHSLIYERCNRLKILDLSNNQFNSLAANEFKFLTNLRSLFLDGNQISSLTDYTFNGLQLDKLTLSRNGMVNLSPCAFCNCSVTILDLATNRFTVFGPRVLAPLSESLAILRVANNSHLVDGSTSIENLITPLNRLTRLYLSSVNLDDSFSTQTFLGSSVTLVYLDLSYNLLINISETLIAPLVNLEVLNLSFNKMRGLTPVFISTLASLDHLKSVYLEGSHWSCYRCHISPLKDWLNSQPIPYESTCQKGTASCVRCSTPSDLYGRHVRDTNEFDLEWCPDPTISLRLATSEPRIGLILALIIIVSIIVIIIVIVVMYKSGGAVYYTHEDDRLSDKTVFTIQQAARATAMAFSPTAISSSGSSPPMSPNADTITSNHSSPNSHQLHQTSKGAIQKSSFTGSHNKPSMGNKKASTGSNVSSHHQTKPKMVF
ncbi:insulin-like growth factor-binding protein complex acid labile subunit [Tetranychus urticae]|uniref:LRRCT domain-containing protein n=1 Tax=Tetranychus urticae TaxID=32264 RepID=T1K5G1_TETUR|nr:insulin-like growth factor-binding protein complex acid labile subunit [Tetranychus urticae]